MTTKIPKKQNKLQLHNFWYRKDRQDVLESLKTSPGLWARYRSLEQNIEWQEWFIDFLSGEKVMPILYDSFFKRLFHPDIHPERLSSLLSSILGKKVKVLKILSNEDVMIDGGALIIMDIVVELEDGSIANVEVQKIPYLFPAERMSCYSSDLLIRQYSRVKGEKGASFTYGDLKKVYTIVFFEKTTEEFKDDNLHGNYIHTGRTTFNTGLNLELLQEYYIIALDVFKKNIYPKVRENADYMQTAWLSLLTTNTLSDAEELLNNYPCMEDILRDMAEYLHKPKEVLGMFSDALRQLDKNTELYMIEILEKKNKELLDTYNTLQNKNSDLQNKNSDLQSENSNLQNEIATLKNEKTSMQNKADAMQKKIDELNQQLNMYKNNS